MSGFLAQPTCFFFNKSTCSVRGLAASLKCSDANWTTQKNTTETNIKIPPKTVALSWKKERQQSNRRAFSGWKVTNICSSFKQVFYFILRLFFLAVRPLNWPWRRVFGRTHSKWNDVQLNDSFICSAIPVSLDFPSDARKVIQITTHNRIKIVKNESISPSRYGIKRSECQPEPESIETRPSWAKKIIKDAKKTLGGPKRWGGHRTAREC